LGQYRLRAFEYLFSNRYKNETSLGNVPLSELCKNHCKIAINVTATLNQFSVAIDALTLTSSSKPPQYVPMTLVHKENVSKDDKLHLAFCGSIVAQELDHPPPFGRILYGDKYRSIKVHLNELITKATEIMHRIVVLKESDNPPPLYMNKHCQICEFANDCRLTALENDNLSLLPGLTPKDIAKLNNKGIFTITQYSYTFRPRRRRKQPNHYRNRHRPELKALAIRENKIYVHGTPELPQSTVAIYLDIEGIPDRRFYYLIGLLIVDRGCHAEYSLWADGPDEQPNISRDFLKLVTKYEDYTIVNWFQLGSGRGNPLI